jgi:hypothetical protein
MAGPIILPSGSPKWPPTWGDGSPDCCCGGVTCDDSFRINFSSQVIEEQPCLPCFSFVDIGPGNGICQLSAILTSSLYNSPLIDAGVAVTWKRGDIVNGQCRVAGDLVGAVDAGSLPAGSNTKIKIPLLYNSCTTVYHSGSLPGFCEDHICKIVTGDPCGGGGSYATCAEFFAARDADICGPSKNPRVALVCGNFVNNGCNPLPSFFSKLNECYAVPLSRPANTQCGTMAGTAYFPFSYNGRACWVTVNAFYQYTSTCTIMSGRINLGTKIGEPGGFNPPSSGSIDGYRPELSASATRQCTTGGGSFTAKSTPLYQCIGANSTLSVSFS